MNSKNDLRDKSDHAFTLLELLVVIAMAAVLALMLMPALAASKPDSKVMQCLNSKRQLSAAWTMYAQDYADSVASCTTWISSSGSMSWTSSPANTNTAFLTDPSMAVIAPYIKSAAVFKCPADYYQSAANPGPRVRSISMNGVIGGLPSVQGSVPGGGTYFGNGGLGPVRKITDLSKPGPARIFLILDEHPDSINDGAFLLDPGSAPGNQYWRSLPASYHNGGVGISFTDGHSEIHRWNSSGVRNPGLYSVKQDGSTPWNGSTGGPKFTSEDYEWMNAGMPYR